MRAVPYIMVAALLLVGAGCRTVRVRPIGEQTHYEIQKALDQMEDATRGLTIGPHGWKRL